MNSYRSLEAIQSDLSAEIIDMPSLVNHYLQRIEETVDLNIFLEVFKSEILDKAAAVQSKIKAGNAGKLAGMVIAIKDNICYKDHKISASSKILKDFESLYSATAINRLLAEDALIIGRVNCDEFAMGGSNENSAYGPVKNPVNKDYVPGGSSGGSAAAVAADCCLVALGSDTGGSIRQPASFCGVVGIKPTYGRISRHGLIAFASSFDQIGPLSQSVSDAALVLEIMAGKDSMDTTSSSQKVDAYSDFSENPKPLKIGFIQECLDSKSLDPEVKESQLKLIEQLRAEGHTVDPVRLEELDYLVPTYYVLTTAEASSNLSRYDGIHYGYRSSAATDIESTYLKSRTEGFGKEVKRRIMLGSFVLSAGYYDAYYGKAQKVRRLIKEKTESLFEDYDLLLSPTTPATAFKFGANMDDPIKMYLEDIFTVHANLVGTPAISLPLFKHSKSGLPFGAQFMSAAFNEKLLLDFSHNLMNIVALKA
ncbi:Asp-tRNA(Asn)/Glu-tRNA(Gln) amidotransferase subunit GatA [Cryomorpha ignava]|uniref:Glutamyl-tRNA(Gln) amidotransferase subunit A n=1 Tax=Cryomorpha ignava TaxID=101383 RepID=A0A7K3WKU3_9FLAO|nr:Asp-tRNA(Asn)/Glu-tRNA(Gln) amidotransferase subunit GatA [Cryomorpha ignava]NEN22114.1 Asp-tRNA(Asn)/Glu-tRNA(Gln) amidotransferase subunit GatA [Cryomorpha ignava]